MDEVREESMLNEIRPTKSGAVVVLILLVVFPLLIDLFLFTSKLKIGLNNGLLKLLTTHYLKLLPFFIIYLILALLVMYLFKRAKIRL